MPKDTKADATLTLEIDPDAATLDDLEHFDNPSNTWLLDFCDRVVVGGVRGKGIPLRRLPEILDAVKEALGVEGTEKNGR